jgi:Flp pilus assembly protein TadD
MKTLRDRVIGTPGDLNARLELGRVYEKRGFPELALDHYRWAAEHSPESPEAHLLLAQALNRTGHAAEGLTALDTFLREHPQNEPELYSWLGIMRDDAGDWKGSEQAYRHAISVASADRDYLHNNLGYSLLKQGQGVNAAVEFRKALKLNPHSEIARDNLGVALASNPKEAILNWQSMNEPATAHSNLAAVLIEQGKYAEARKELQVALQYNQSNPAALKNLELLSSLDGKQATVTPATHLTRWSRIRSAWQRWFGGEGQPAGQGQEKIQTASQTSESKQ